LGLPEITKKRARSGERAQNRSAAERIFEARDESVGDRPSIFALPRKAVTSVEPNSPLLLMYRLENVASRSARFIYKYIKDKRLGQPSASVSP
jgi:hypothetical protein